MEYLEIPNKIVTNIYDKHVGCKRSEYKKYDRTIVYLGFEIKRNSNVDRGGYGYWEVPKLKYFTKGGMQIGFLTVSITQAKEAIDKYMKFNV